MKPILVGIGGAHSGAGKTAVACRILERFKGLGAIKCTPSAVYTSITDNPETLNEMEKDTALMHRAGAEKVIWVRSSRDDLKETLEIALSRLSGHEIVIIEGNSAIEVLNPDIVIFISGDPDKFKKNAKGILGRASLVIYKNISPDVPDGAASFNFEDFDGYLGFLSRMFDGRKSDGNS